MFLLYFTILYRSVMLGVFLWGVSKWIFKNLPNYTLFIFLAISFAINIWQFPDVKVAVKKVVKYPVVEIKLDFNTTLTPKEQKSNIEQLIRYFKGHEKQYSSSFIPVGTRYRSAPIAPKNYSATISHYWKFENNSLYLYISTPLNSKTVNIFRDMLNDRFFSTLQIPKSLNIDSITQPLYIQMLLKDYNLKELKPLKLDSNYTSVSIINFNSGKIGEEKAICAFTFKLTKEYWSGIYEQSKKHNLPLKLMIGLKKETPTKEFKIRLYKILSIINLKVKLYNKTFNAKVLTKTYDKIPEQYLSLILEKYDEGFLDKNKSKPHILVNPTFKDKNEDIKSDCYKNVIFKYPKLRELVTKKTYLKNFNHKPTSISVKKTKFSPLYNNVKKIDSF